MRLSAIFTSLAALMLLCVASSASASCSVATTTTATVTYSPNAATATLPSTSGGFGCTAGTSLLSLLGGNYLKVAVSSTTSFKLTQSGASDIPYTLSVYAAGTPTLSGTSTYLVNGTILDVLGLLGSAPTSVPIYIKPTISGPVKSGVYTGSFKATWDWYYCTVALAGACVGSDTGAAKSSDITVTLTIRGGMPATMTMTTVTTWDDQNTTSNPKAIPGGKKRVTLTVSNPDSASLSSGTMALVIPTPSNMSIALDGDGAGGDFATFTEGSPASNLAFSYVSSTSTSDDVDFSTDGGSTWTASPTAATQASINAIRLKPRGAMAAGSNFKVTVAYVVK